MLLLPYLCGIYGSKLKLINSESKSMSGYFAMTFCGLFTRSEIAFNLALDSNQKSLHFEKEFGFANLQSKL